MGVNWSDDGLPLHNPVREGWPTNRPQWCWQLATGPERMAL